MNLDRLRTLPQMTEEFPALPERRIRHWLAKKEPGIEKCVFKIGGRVLVELDLLAKFIEQHARKSAAQEERAARTRKRIEEKRRAIEGLPG